MKKRKLAVALLLSVSMILPAPAYAAHAEEKDLNSNLIGYYSLDGENVNQDTLLVTNEASKGEIYNGKLGSLANAEQTSIQVSDAGISGDALLYSGDKAESYFKIPQVINSAEDFAISVWMKMNTSSPVSETAINIIQQTDETKTGRTVLFARNKALGSYVGGSNILGKSQLTYGEWKHVVISGTKKEDNTIQFQVYLNAELEIDQNISSDNLVDKLTDLQFGCNKNVETGFSYSGLLDEIRIYNAPADEELVQELFQEHGEKALLSTLKKEANDAQAMIDQQLLPPDHELMAALRSEVENAMALDETASYQEIASALESLREAVRLYQEELAKLSITIRANPDNVVREIPDYMFGINHRYHMDSYGAWNPDTDELYTEFRELSDSAKFGSIRYPGGIVANLFKWKNSIGPKEERKTTIHGDWNEPSITPNFGLDEAARFIVDESNAEIIYVYNFGNGSAADAADLVEYLNCEPGENPNGGIDWAQVRADNGHPEAYHVKNFEIGNEVDQGRGYWMMENTDTWSGSGERFARMYAEGEERTFIKEKTAEADNWNSTNDKSKASYLSNGLQNQKKYMRYANDVSDQTDKSKAVQEDSVHVYVSNVEWNIVDDLSTVGESDLAVQIDYETGEILFGDGVHGKIPEVDKDIRVTYTVYKDGISDYYDAMRAVDPEIRVYSGFANENIAKVIANSEKAGADGGKFDGIVVHPYSMSQGTISDDDPLFYEKILDRINSHVIGQVTSPQNELNKYWPDGSKNVALSEFGIFNHSGDVVQSQSHAVYIAENLMKFVDLGVAYTDKHCLIDFPVGDVLGPGKQAVILAYKQTDGSFRFQSTPSLKVFSIFNTMSGTQVLDSQILNNRKFYQSVDTINGMVTKDEDGNIYCIAVNTARDSETAVNIDMQGMDLTGSNIEVMSLSGDDVYAVNSLDDPNHVDIVTETATSSTPIFTYQMPAHSIVGFKITPWESVAVTGISVTPETAVLDKNHRTIQLQETIVPENATNKNVSWTSSRPEVADVSSSGLVTAVSNGTAVITAITEDGSYMAGCTVTVTLNEAVTGVFVTPETAVLNKDHGTIQLKETIAPQNATNKNVRWASSRPEVAAVSSSGLVTAVANGTAEITVTTVDGNHTAKCTVTVNIPAPVVKPGKVTGVKTQSYTTKSLKVTWNKQKQADTYEVWYYNPAKKKWKAAGRTSSSSFTIKKLASGTKYKVKVIASNKAGKGKSSKIVKTATKPVKITKFAVKKEGSRGVKLTYKKIPCTNYEIYMKIGNAKYKKVKETGKTSWIKSKLKPGKRYTFRVRAYVKNGSVKVYGPYSRKIKITVK